MQIYTLEFVNITKSGSMTAGLLFFFNLFLYFSLYIKSTFGTDVDSVITKCKYKFKNLNHKQKCEKKSKFSMSSIPNIYLRD